MNGRCRNKLYRIIYEKMREVTNHEVSLLLSTSIPPAEWHTIKTIQNPSLSPNPNDNHSVASNLLEEVMLHMM